MLSEVECAAAERKRSSPCRVFSLPRKWEISKPDSQSKQTRQLPAFSPLILSSTGAPGSVNDQRHGRYASSSLLCLLLRSEVHLVAPCFGSVTVTRVHHQHRQSNVDHIMVKEEEILEVSSSPGRSLLSADQSVSPPRLCRLDTTALSPTGFVRLW